MRQWVHKDAEAIRWSEGRPLIWRFCPGHCFGIAVRYRIYSVAGRRCVRQCVACGWLYGIASNQEGQQYAATHGPLEPVDEALAADGQAIMGALHAAYSSARQRAMRMAWFRDHNEYLATAEWQRRRTEVIRRERGRCERCHADANQVHHKTYARWGEEPLDDLELLCRQCHDRHHAGADENLETEEQNG